MCFHFENESENKIITTITIQFKLTIYGVVNSKYANLLSCDCITLWKPLLKTLTTNRRARVLYSNVNLTWINNWDWVPKCGTRRNTLVNAVKYFFFFYLNISSEKSEIEIIKSCSVVREFSAYDQSFENFQPVVNSVMSKQLACSQFSLMLKKKQLLNSRTIVWINPY